LSSIVSIYQTQILIFLVDEGDELKNLTLGHFCGDLMEETMDDDGDHLSCDFQDVLKKSYSLCLEI